MDKNHSKESKRIQKENVVLIQEINQLKQEQYKLTIQIHKQKKLIEGNNQTMQFTEESNDQNDGGFGSG